MDSTDCGHCRRELHIDSDDPLVLDRSHTLGIGIYDERKVAIGAYNQFGRGQHIAMIVSTDDRVVEWASDMCNLGWHGTATSPLSVVSSAIKRHLVVSYRWDKAVFDLLEKRDTRRFLSYRVVEAVYSPNSVLNRYTNDD
ncbi:hypothetical protein [Haladaptatus pallidirubidus]|nr:hypothetical protein [Haladaptatus pallidirubidus]